MILPLCDDEISPLHFQRSIAFDELSEKRAKTHFSLYLRPTRFRPNLRSS